jgi:DNA-binding IclR family transcriptional regulator
MDKDKPKNKYNVPSLEKALCMIETLAEQDKPMGVSDLCKLMDIPKTSAFFILNTLESHAYISKTEDGKYKLGTKFLTLGATILNKLDIRHFAIPFMQKLMEDCKFTVHLAVLDQGEALFIEKLENQGFVKFSTYIGQRQPLHVSGVGKALAGFISESLLDEILVTKGLPRKTENTITTIREFKAALGTIRKQGFAVEDEEGEIGVRCIGAPIFDARSRLKASISVTALRAELTIHEIPVIGNKVKQTALEISRSIGYSGDDFPVDNAEVMIIP